MAERIEMLSGIDPSSNDMCSCLLTNQTRCACTEDLFAVGSAITVIAYNPLPKTRRDIIEVPISAHDIGKLLH